MVGSTAILGAGGAAARRAELAAAVRTRHVRACLLPAPYDVRVIINDRTFAW